MSVRKNSAGSVYSRRRLNFIEGSGITLTVAEDAGNEEVDITIAASGAAQIGFRKDDSLVGTRGKINMLTGGGTVLTLTDDAGNDEVEVTVKAGKIQKDEKTSTTSITATSEGTANTIITTTSATYTNVEHEVEFFAPSIALPGSNIAVTIVLLCDTTVIGQATFKGSSTQNVVPVMVKAHHTPSAAAHTYTAKAFVGSGTGTIGGGAGGSGNELPAYLKVSLA